MSAPSPGQCWLYWDGASSEVTDFVHLDVGSAPKRLTLFHAKGASSKKATCTPAPGHYEVATAQAIKNLRALDAKQLIARIHIFGDAEAPQLNRELAKQIAKDFKTIDAVRQAFGEDLSFEMLSEIRELIERPDQEDDADHA